MCFSLPLRGRRSRFTEQAVQALPVGHQVHDEPEGHPGAAPAPAPAPASGIISQSRPPTLLIRRRIKHTAGLCIDGERPSCLVGASAGSPFACRGRATSLIRRPALVSHRMAWPPAGGGATMGRWSQVTPEGSWRRLVRVRAGPFLSRWRSSAAPLCPGLGPQRPVRCEGQWCMPWQAARCKT